MRLDDLSPRAAAWLREQVRTTLAQHPDWTERELIEHVTRELGNGLGAYDHPTVLRALEEADPQRMREIVEDDPEAMDGLLSAELAPMILEVARESQ